jgi:hypothetical protein
MFKVAKDKKKHKKLKSLLDEVRIKLGKIEGE